MKRLIPLCLPLLLCLPSPARADEEAPKILADQIYGRKDGISGGKAGSMHLAAPQVGLMGSSAVVASTIPHAVGAALSFALEIDVGACGATGASAVATFTGSGFASTAVLRCCA